MSKPPDLRVVGDIDPSLVGRNGEIWRLYCRGVNQVKLADKFSLSQGRVSQIITEIRASISAPDREDHRRQHLEVLAEARAELSKLALEDPVTALDTSDRMAAFRELRAYLEREAKMLGLDEAERLDATVTEVPLTSAVAARLEQARRRQAEQESEMRDAE